MNKKILIIDDDETMCEELEEIFRDEGYAVHSIYNGLDGKAELERTDYDLLFLDIKVPQYSGFDILRWLKSVKKALKTIVLTGRPLNAEITKYVDNTLAEEEGLLKYASFVLNKPFNIELLLDKVRELLGDQANGVPPAGGKLP